MYHIFGKKKVDPEFDKWQAEESHLELINSFLYAAYAQSGSVRMLGPGEAYQEVDIRIGYDMHPVYMGEHLYTELRRKVVGPDLIFDIAGVKTIFNKGELIAWMVQFNIAESILPGNYVERYPIDKIEHTVVRYND